MISQKIRKGLGLRLAQELWAALGRCHKKTGLPVDKWALRLSILTLAPLYIFRLGWANGLVTLGRFFIGRGDFTIHRSGSDPGLYIRKTSTDAYVYQQIFITQDYSRCQGRDNVLHIIDVGAYVGFSAIYFSELYPNATVYAIEAELSNFEQLQKNVRHYSKIIAIHAALWSEDGRVAITADAAASGQWGFNVRAQWGSQETQFCRALTLTTIMEQYQIPSLDIIKIDIEGAESAVFAAASCHSWLTKVKFLIIELHDHIFPESHLPFVKAMEDYAFDIQSQGENMIFEFKKVD